MYIYIYTHTPYTYYSTIKKNEVMPFAATWMDLEFIILSKLEEERQIPYDSSDMWNWKYDINEVIYKTETVLQIQKTNLWLPKEKGDGGG